MSGDASGERSAVSPDAEEPDWDDDLVAARWATYVAAAERSAMLGV